MKTFQVTNHHWLISTTDIGAGIISARPTQYDCESLFKIPQLPLKSAREAGSYVVADWFGRLPRNILAFEGIEYPIEHPKPYSLHAYWPDVTAAQVLQSSQTECSFIFNRDQLPKNHPFPHDIEIRYTVIDKTFRTELKVTNGEKRRPFSGCFHPFFRSQLIKDSPHLSLQFNAQQFYRWSGLIPYAMSRPGPIPNSRNFSRPTSVLQAPYDHTYEGWDGSATLSRSEPKLSLQLTSNMTRFHIFSGMLDAEDPIIAIEPVIDPAGITDLVEKKEMGPSSMTILAPREVRTWWMELSLS